MKQGNSASKPAAKPAVIKIRRACESDLPALDALYRELKLDEYDTYAPTPAKLRAGFRRIAGSHDDHLIVAECEGKVAGTIHVHIFRHLGHGVRPSAIVENVVVADAMRSRGIGEKMLEAAKAIAIRERCYKIALTSRTHRAGAHRFYERLGWRHSHHGFSLALD